MGQTVERVRKRWRWGVPHVDYFVDSLGRQRWYYRRRGEKRGPALPDFGTAGFLTAWKAAHEAAETGLPPVAGVSRSKPGTLSAAIALYYASSAWNELAPGSQKFRRLILEKFRAEFGDGRLKGLQRGHIQALMKRHKPNVQKNWGKALGGLLRFAVATELIDVNPMDGVVKDKATRTDGHIAWTEENLAAYRAHWPLGTTQRIAVELMVNLGVRRSDACRIGPSDIRNGYLVDFMPKKTARTTKQKLTLPIRRELSDAIAAMSVVSTAAYVVTAYGRPFTSEDSFGNWMRTACDAAGLPVCTSHGLRKLAAIRLALAGCSAMELCKVFGWKTLAVAQVYVDQADQMRMAEQAMARLEAYQNENKTI